MRISVGSVVRAALIALVTVLACSGGGAVDMPSPPGAASSVAPGVVRDPGPTGGRVIYELPSGGESTLSIRTLPNAVCLLHAADDVDASSADHLDLYADEDGIARLPLRHTGRSVSGADLALDCSDDAGTRLVLAINVRVVVGAPSEGPAPFSRAGKRVLRMLDGAPDAVPREALQARGYPPRPDAGKAPGVYTKWLALVTSGATVLAPHVVLARSGLQGPARTVEAALESRTASTSNWSGYAITSDTSTYGEVFGAWYVPRVSSEPGLLSADYSTFWVGMDGYGTSDVVQAGTSQNTLTIFGIQMSSYGAWTEWYPYSMQSISNFPVNPGDEIETWVWVATAANVWTPSGGTGWFLLWNATQNVASEVTTGAPAGITFSGRTAEWVMERPTVDGKIASLADYGTVQIIDAWAYDYDDEPHFYASDESTEITMTGTSDVLSTVTPETGTSLSFTWHNYR